MTCNVSSGTLSLYTITVTSFWYQNLVSVSGTSVVGIRVYRTWPSSNL